MWQQYLCHGWWYMIDFEYFLYLFDAVLQELNSNHRKIGRWKLYIMIFGSGRALQFASSLNTSIYHDDICEQIVNPVLMHESDRALRFTLAWALPYIKIMSFVTSYILPCKWYLLVILIIQILRNKTQCLSV